MGAFWFAMALGCAHHRVDDWTAVMALDTPEAYAAWLNDHPDDARSPLAEERIDTLAWTRAEVTNDVVAYQNYLLAQPDGRWRSFARIRVEALDHAAALADGSTLALETFLVRHPRGPLADEIRGVLDRQHYGTAAVSNTSGAYGGYLSQNPTGAFVVDARAERERATWEEATQTDTVQAWRAFIERFPDSTRASLAAERMSELRFSDVEIVVWLRSSWRPEEGRERAMMRLAQMVDFTVATSLREQGFGTRIVTRVGDGVAPPAPETWIGARKETGVLFIDVVEEAGPPVAGAGRSTRLAADLTLHAPGRRGAVWREHLETGSTATADTASENELYGSAQDRLGMAMARTPPRAADWAAR